MGVYYAEVPGRGCGAVAGECVERAACGDVVANAGEPEGEEDDDEEAKGAAPRGGRLEVGLCDGKGVCGVEDGVEVVDRVEERDEVDECRSDACRC